MITMSKDVLKQECEIVLQSYSNHISCVNLFFQLCKKYWKGCPYNIMLALVGEKISMNAPISVVWSNKTHPNALYEIALQRETNTIFVFCQMRLSVRQWIV